MKEWPRTDACQDCPLAPTCEEYNLFCYRVYEENLKTEQGKRLLIVSILGGLFGWAFITAIVIVAQHMGGG
jgi:hypothetical protein